MRELTTNTPIPPNSMTELREGHQILLSPDAGGRLMQVQVANL